ncbi:DUF2066 domain-containing protein [Reinekea thalattae]|uniref:DUF2066 domain-containing protein n=1 Tax=Reinekea thalattae TaxID=2593301 RepID=A0A5C8Z8F2_9GAMM|nr:DUF2066 domain-containing protein [Reinekea thalattae]TXR53609.1 DUF2066 domain-containing protein [Reinekea thalattae]
MNFPNARIRTYHGLRALWVSVILCVATATSAWAATDVELYKDQEVISQNANQEEQDEAIRSAFERVLKRVTGRQDVVDDPALIDALENGSRYLSTFRFEASDEFFTNILGEQIPTKTMMLEFDDTAVNSLLIEYQLPVWGSRRPEVLVWLADRSQDREHIVSDADSGPIVATFDRLSSRLGLPYILPIMDLTDTLNMEFPNLYGLFSEDIEKASSRYTAEAVLAGRLDRQGSRYKADWLILFKGMRIPIETAEGSRLEVINAGLAAMAEQLSDQYAYLSDGSDASNIQVQVVDVHSAKTFADIDRYLGSVNLITQSTLAEIAEDKVTFNVMVSGTQQQLADLLSLDRKLAPELELTLEEQLDSTLVYRWIAY